MKVNAREHATELSDGLFRSRCTARGPAIVGPVTFAAAEPTQQPEDADKLVAKFRFLSADTDIHESGGLWLNVPEAVLKAGVSKWASNTDASGASHPVPLKVDHSYKTLDVVGRVLDAQWAARDGNKPGGPEGRVEVDRQLNPVAHRAVQQDLIHAVSTSWEMEWKPSHPDMDPNDFWWKLGDIAEDGKRVTAVGTKIIRVSEVSLVDAGADPLSLRIDAHVDTNEMQGASPGPGNEVEEATMIKLMRARLNMKESATEHDVLGRVDEVLEEVKTSDAVVARVYKALGVECADDAVAKVMRFETEFVHRDDLVAAQAELSKSRVDAALHKAVAVDRKLSPADADNMRPWAELDFAGFEAFLTGKVNGSALPPAGQQAADDPESVDPATSAKATQYISGDGVVILRADLERQATSMGQDVEEVISMNDLKPFAG